MINAEKPLSRPVTALNLVSKCHKMESFQINLQFCDGMNKLSHINDDYLFGIEPLFLFLLTLCVHLLSLPYTGESHFPSTPGPKGSGFGGGGAGVANADEDTYGRNGVIVMEVNDHFE